MNDWAARTTHQIGANIAAARKRIKPKMTAQELAERCTELGVPMTRSALTNLETGRRDGLSVTDLMVIAAALDVPPVTLLFPADQAGEPVEELPGVTRNSITAMLRFTGEAYRSDRDPNYRIGRALRRLHEDESNARGMAEDLAQREDLDDRTRAWMEADITKSLQSALSDRELLRVSTGHEPPIPEDLAFHYMRAERS